MTKIRFGGAQIPVTRNLAENVRHIKDAIYWAHQNKVEYLLTPEGSLSGYFPGWDYAEERSLEKVKAAEVEVVSYAQSLGVGLWLGTMWGEDNEETEEGYQRENQIRFYSKDNFCGKHNKLYIVPDWDQTFPGEDVNLIDVNHTVQNFWATGLCCNDFWGGPLTNKFSLPVYCQETLHTHIIAHATNGMRGEMPHYDEITEAWHEGNLRMLSFTTGVPIITVDTCSKMNGDPYEGKTSSQSGILLNGVWKAKAPRTGTQYFYYDIDHSKMINYDLGEHPDIDIIKSRDDLKGAYC